VALVVSVPFYTLPVLELDDGTCIAESIAICRYFEDVHPEPPLFGVTAKERAEVEMWMRRVEQRLYIPIELSNEDVLPAKSAGKFRRCAFRTMGVLDDRLAESDFIAGESYTIADIYALSAIDFAMRHLKYELPVELDNLGRWYRVVSGCPSATA